MNFVDLSHKNETKANRVLKLILSFMKKWELADGINMKNGQSETALHHAARSGNAYLVNTLISEGANPNSCAKNEKSVLQSNQEAIEAASKSGSGQLDSLTATRAMLIGKGAVLRPTELQQFRKKAEDLDELMPSLSMRSMMSFPYILRL